VVTFFGGLIAIGFSFLVAHFVNGLQVEQLRMEITMSVVITAFTLTLTVGILSGILPAKRASDLKPIDALRFE
jgi:putative ABC transport system permease protein